MAKGKLLNWNSKKGFGFLHPQGSEGNQDVFVHRSGFVDQRCSPDKLVGHWFTYTLATDKQGRPCAKQLKLVGAKPAFANKPNQAARAASLKAALFLALLLSLVLTAKVPAALLVIYLVMSTITFILYALDKSAAQAGRWRVQEFKLHVFAFLGGWPGAMLAQQFLRHKTQKQDFRWVYYATVLLNCAALAYLLTPHGAPFLQSLQKIVAKLVYL
ncbi:DUF1294 domain-containing protein [Agarivorans sp. MS3-6]